MMNKANWHDGDEGESRIVRESRRGGAGWLDAGWMRIFLFLAFAVRR